MWNGRYDVVVKVLKNVGKIIMQSNQGDLGFVCTPQAQLADVLNNS